MKVLLYEPRCGGHRQVILTYVQRALSRHDIAWETETIDFSGQPEALVERAAHARCNIIHVLTADDHVRGLVPLGFYARRAGVKIVTNLYLYNWLYEWPRKWWWRAVLASGLVSRVLISDPQREASRDCGAIRFIPDPWDPEEFRVWNQNDARLRLGLNAEGVVFLCFGDLSKRKGIAQIVEGILTASPRLPQQVCFLFAGRASVDARGEFEALRARLPVHVWRIDDHHVPEAMVSAYFYAADAVITCYPPWFKVSSGTITRALAAGRPLVSTEHGASGEFIRSVGAGWTFQWGNSHSLANALIQAIEEKTSKPHLLLERSFMLKEISHSRTLDAYSRKLVRALTSV